MKTIQDLKIGDAVFYLTGYEVRQSKIATLGGNYAVGVGDGSYSACTRESIKWIDIKDNTSFITYYGNKYYTSQSEAIIEVKEKIKKAIEEQAEKVQKETNELLALKDEMYKYL